MQNGADDMNHVSAIPRADDADLAEQSDGAITHTLFTDEPTADLEADPADVLEQRTAVDEEDEEMRTDDFRQDGDDS
ncbi:hypothetical protein SBI67_23655 [Mycolicibacterium sp. 120266]|uniref:hypothetical protein n=1 Tax=Mycolicibacterium sp. 120266 TaxID=3090601 RepID=UPI00299D5C62|nr:hypothetical protein [Mycolicibacterium sp. 120266]MDX1875124.1 hypothetical protein [Mycolicibacterium sp. 120266]